MNCKLSLATVDRFYCYVEDATFSVSSPYGVKEDRLRTGSSTHGDHGIGAVGFSILVRSSSSRSSWFIRANSWTGTGVSVC